MTGTLVRLVEKVQSAALLGWVTRGDHSAEKEAYLNA